MSESSLDLTSSEYSNSSNSSSSSDTTLNIDLTGDIINNYNVITMIGKGSYSRVWLVYCVEDNKYYALKVQNPEDFSDGEEEINILKKIHPDEPYINKLKKYFIETRFINDTPTDFMCSVYNLCSGNLDGLARKGKYNKGYPLELVKKMLIQILNALHTVHYKLNGFHGDIKPDNILLCGVNNRDKKYIEMYTHANFNDIYIKTKNEYCRQKNLKTLDTTTRQRIRKKVHSAIIESMEKNNENPYYCNDKYFQNPIIKLTDFGFFCHNSEKFNESFGTRYYMAPEIILMGPCNEKVDIWALGCMLYELVTGEILFDPHSDKRGSTNFHHLEMIINLCGNFNKNLLKKTEHAHKYFNGDKLIDIIYDKDFNLSIVEKIYNKLKEHDVVDIKLSQLLANTLQIDPKNRPTIKDLLKHEWLNNSVI